MMRILKGMLLSCLLFLHGCDSVYGQNSVYEQKNGALQYGYVKTAGEVFYRGMPVVGADVATFEVKPDLEGDARKVSGLAFCLFVHPSLCCRGKKGE